MRIEWQLNQRNHFLLHPNVTYWQGDMHQQKYVRNLVQMREWFLIVYCVDRNCYHFVRLAEGESSAHDP